MAAAKSVARTFQLFSKTNHALASSSRTSSRPPLQQQSGVSDPLAQIRERIAAEGAQALDSHHRRIVLLGPPGVGKGTYGRLLSEKLGVPHISTGDLVRAELSKRGTEEMNAMNKGKLLGDDVVLRLLWERLSEEEGGSGGGYILDGVPRTATQAVMLEETGVAVDVALNFRVAEEEAMVEKCMGRRVCSECGRGYNLADVVRPPHLFFPARLPPPSCAANLRVRADDACESVVRQRLRVYNGNMAPVELHYEQQKKLMTIDVGPGAESSWPKIVEAVRRREEQQQQRSFPASASSSAFVEQQCHH